MEELSEHEKFQRQYDYDRFMEEYDRNHACCPKCGSIEYMTTLVGYVLNLDKKDEYKDKNRCRCGDCGDTHITHDRVPFHYNEASIIGRKALIIDMINMTKKEVIIEEAPEINKIWFEDSYDWTHFYNDHAFNSFVQGKPSWIHPDEVLICLI